jgi:hypothetical protein
MTDSPKIAIADIIEVVSAYYGVSPIAIRSRRKDTISTTARQVVCWFGCNRTEYSSGTIGSKINRDHSTVLHGRDKVEEMRADPEFRATLDGLEAAIIVAAQLRARRMIPTPAAIDPYEVARRVVEGGDRAAGMLSIAEIRAMCEALETEHQPHDELTQLRKSVADLVAARREVERARFSTGERAANVRLERALTALSKQLSTEVDSNA